MFILQNKYLLDTANKLNAAYADIAQLRSHITEMERRHNQEVELIRAGHNARSNRDIEAVQDSLANEQRKAEQLKTTCIALNNELKNTTTNLLKIIQGEQEKGEQLKTLIEKSEQARLDDLNKYNERLLLIKKRLEEIYDLNLATMINKIDYSSRESLWLVSQLGRLMKERKSKL